MNQNRVTLRLQSLGYLPPADSLPNEVLELGLREFQGAYGLAVSGDLDEPTVEALEAPRCGVEDRDTASELLQVEQKVNVTDGKASLLHTHLILSRNVVAQGCPWPNITKTFTLNYVFVGTVPADRRLAVRHAMDRWEEVVDGAGVKIVKFVEDASASPVHFTIGWAVPNDAGYDLMPNDIARACPPCRCGSPKPLRFRGNNALWSSNGTVPGMFNIEAVAIHELGHILGLVHPAILDGSIMDPRFSDQLAPRDIDARDVQRLRKLYSP